MLLTFGWPCYTAKRPFREIFQSSSPVARLESIVFKKLIVVTALLLFAMTQSFMVNCGLSCALMSYVTGSRTCGEHGRIAKSRENGERCHGMVMQREDQGAVQMGGHTCDATSCKAELLAVTKDLGIRALHSNTEPWTLLRTATLLMTATDGAHSRSHQLISRHSETAPLELRPGSALRI
jgi:hypothetical protein